MQEHQHSQFMSNKWWRTKICLSHAFVSTRYSTLTTLNNTHFTIATRYATCACPWGVLLTLQLQESWISRLASWSRLALELKDYKSRHFTAIFMLRMYIRTYSWWIWIAARWQQRVCAWIGCRPWGSSSRLQVQLSIGPSIEVYTSPCSSSSVPRISTRY